MSMNKLEPKSNAIRNLDPKLFSFDTKKEMIQTLKEKEKYQKDESLKTEKIENHKKKQDVINKLVTDGRSEEDISTLKGILYPDSVNWSLEKGKEWVTEEMRSDMDYRYNEMDDSNKPSKEDMEKLYELPLSVREEWWEKVISLEWYGEFWSTVNSGMEYRDMDKDWKREIDNLWQSKKFLTFKDKVKWMEMMWLEDTYKLMNIVWKQLWITDKIDLNYINTVYGKYPDENLSKDNNLWRILRCLSVIVGKWFVIPISVDGKAVRSVHCINVNTCFYDNDHVSNHGTRPLFKVDSSPSK